MKSQYHSIQEVMNAYGLTNKDLSLVCKAYERYFQVNGIAFEYIGKEDVKEYALQEDFETGTSNGERISLERSIKKAGGWHVRAFDMFHLIGHYCQWNYVGHSAKLDFVGDYAWEVGVSDFTRPENSTELALRYEMEAAAIAVHFLNEVLKLSSALSEQKKSAIYNFMLAFQAADKEMLRAFYDHGQALSHSQLWDMNAAPIQPISIDLPRETRAVNRNRENLAIIPVLHFAEARA